MSTTDSLDTACDCCTGLAPITTENNRPGLPALAYRLATYSQFFERMKAQISSPSLLASPPATGNWSLSALSTRSTDDPIIALLDAWAVVLDVLTFYQERIANEGYLRTATERQSVLQLAREIGYELSPGVAAGTYLSFLIEDTIGTAVPTTTPQTPRTPSAPTQGGATYNAGIVLLDTGTQVQSIPPQGSLPQTFETSSPLQARTAWNIMLPRLTRFSDLALTATGQLVLLDVRTSFAPGTATVSLTSDTAFLLNPSTPSIPTTGAQGFVLDHIFLGSTTTGIASGDLLLLVGVNGSGQISPVFMQARAITINSTLGQTRIDFSNDPADPTFELKLFPQQTVPSAPQILNQSIVQSLILTKTISESDLQALIRISGWDQALLTSMVNGDPAPATTGVEGIYTFASEASFFGHNAPLWSSLPDPSKSQRSDPYPVDWDSLHAGTGPYISQNSQGQLYGNASVYLERSFEVLPATLAAIEPIAGPLLALEVTSVADKSLADYNLSGKSTGLTLERLDQQPILNFSAPTVLLMPDGSVTALACANGSIYQMGTASTGLSVEPALRAPGLFVNRPAILLNSVVPVWVFTVDATGKLYNFNLESASSNWSAPGYFAYEDVYFSGTPSVVTAAAGTPNANRIDLFVAMQNGTLVHFYLAWYGWSTINFLTANNMVAAGSSPAAIGGGPSVLEVFFITPSGQLFHMSGTGAGLGPALAVFSPQISTLTGLPVTLMGSPTAGVKGPTNPPGENNIDVFAHGTNGHLYHAWYLLSSDSWTGLEDLGVPSATVTFTGDPCLIDDGPSPLEIFAIGSDGNLYHTWWNTTQWWGPAALSAGAQFVGSPSAIAIGKSRIEVTAAGLDGTVYLIEFNGIWFPPVALGGSLEFATRSTKLHFNSQQQLLVEPPVTDNLIAGSTSLMLNGFVPGLTVGMALALTGERSDATDVITSEILLLNGIAHHGGFTELQIASPGLQYSYLRKTVTINANTVLATNGASIPVAEILGSGDATQANQSFTLSRTPLTYVPADTTTGSESTLTIRVNNLLWNEAPSLYGLGPSDRCYTIREDDDGTVTITFGDGISGARLPSGQNNISAQYRTGIGVGGNVAAGTLSMVQSRPPGLRSVNNAVPASGGADPQVIEDARTNAPRTVLTIDRIVSVSDYENFTATFAGIGKAQAILVPLQSASFSIIHITIAGAQGAAVDPTSDLSTSLAATIDTYRDPTPYVHIASYQSALFNLSAALVLDPTYVAADVLAAATAAVSNYFSFAKRSFAQPVLAAEAIAALQAVGGVVAVELQALYRIDAQPPAGSNQVLPILTSKAAGLPAGASETSVASIFSSLLPAELLLLNPIGLTLTEKMP